MTSSASPCATLAVDRTNLYDCDQTLAVTINDPKAYTKPFEAMKYVFTWNPKQEFDEQLCVPSESIEYNKTFQPAGISQ